MVVKVDMDGCSGRPPAEGETMKWTNASSDIYSHSRPHVPSCIMSLWTVCAYMSEWSLLSKQTERAGGVSQLQWPPGFALIGHSSPTTVTASAWDSELTSNRDQFLQLGHSAWDDEKTDERKNTKQQRPSNTRCKIEKTCMNKPNHQYMIYIY